MPVIESIVASESPFFDERHWTGFGGGPIPTVAGVPVTEQGAMQLSAYWAAIRNIAEDTAKLPLKVYELINEDGDKREARDHPLWKILHTAPNPLMTAQAWRETMTHHAVGWGGGFSEIVVALRGGPVQLWPIHPSRVDVKVKEGAGGRVGVEYHVADNAGTITKIPPRRMLHVHGLGEDGIQGYSVLRWAAESIGAGIGAQQYAASFYRNATVGIGALESDQDLDEDYRRELREEFMAMHSGALNQFKPILLQGGIKWKNLGLPPEDAQLLQTRNFTVIEIARWFRMPPHKIAHLERSTFNNITEQNIEYVQDTLDPWLIRWEQAIGLRLLMDEPRVFAEHVAMGLLRGDPKTRAEFWRKLWMVGGVKQNEIRRAENLNSLGPIGDETYVPASQVNARFAATNNPFTAKPARAPNSNRQLRDKQRGIFLRLFEDAGERIRTKETKAEGRTIKKLSNDVDSALELDAWRKKFYAADGEHAKYLASILEPLARGYLESIGVTRAVNGALSNWVQSKLELSRYGEPHGASEIANTLMESIDGPEQHSR